MGKQIVYDNFDLPPLTPTLHPHPPWLVLQVSIVTAFRILRVFRVFRWLRGAKAISYVRKTLDAVAASLPRLFYVVVLLLLIVFMYEYRCGVCFGVCGGVCGGV